MNREQLIAALGATAEVMGQKATPTALNIMADDLSEYDESAVVSALKSLRRKNERFCVASILKYIQATDGRPSPDKAWAMMPKSEYDTGVVTPEMMSAWSVASEQYDSGDEIGAQIAFKREYALLVDAAREDAIPSKWQISFGFDKTKRVGPVIDAIREGLISQEVAEIGFAGDIPAIEQIKQVTGNLLLESSKKLISNSSESNSISSEIAKTVAMPPEEAKKRLDELRGILSK